MQQATISLTGVTVELWLGAFLFPSHQYSDTQSILSPSLWAMNRNLLSHKKQQILIESPRILKEIACPGWEASRLDVWQSVISVDGGGHCKQWIINDLMKIHRRGAESNWYNIDASSSSVINVFPFF